jgi:hypothetical protein
MRVPLTRGLHALVDEADYERVMAFKWSVRPDKKTAYAQRAIVLPDGRTSTQQMHNFIADSVGVDHINRNGLDNRRSNLRPATTSQNNANQGRRRDNTSGFKGVSWHASRKRWNARIGFQGKTISLGHYLTREEAARAYDQAAIEMYGEYAVLNFPRENCA